MYHFFLGTREEIEADERRFLLSVKRMLPRWLNSLPDTEFLALASLLDHQGQAVAPRPPIFVETGVGASSLAFIFYAMKYRGKAYSWDLNASKGSHIRTACTETIGEYFQRRVDSHWDMIGFSSTSPYAGIPVLHDLTEQVDVFFHDSHHVWDTIKRELEAVSPLLVDGSIVALDDANLDYRHTNIGYINIVRLKLGLDRVAPIPDNQTEPFYQEITRFLKDRFHTVERRTDQFKEDYTTDPYYDYYSAEMSLNKQEGALSASEMGHRFNSWVVSNRKSGR